MALAGLDCRSCKDKQGCETEAPYPIWEIDFGFRISDFGVETPQSAIRDPQSLYRCPVRLITPESAELLELHAACKAVSGLPFAGGVLDQPARLIEASRVIDATVAKWQKDREGVRRESARG